MNLGDPQFELIDPTPNIHCLFVQFDKMFFWEQLTSKTAVRWSKRMYSCAGTCTYENKAGFCDIALSEPLLKLRPRKDLVETLLHEMIHAFLFATNKDQDRDGHGPNFKSHMHRINKRAGLNISIYHNFHDEVELYLTHWWRCNGPCRSKKPHFGIVRRSMNKAPGPYDYWWNNHLRSCGGTFVKIKSPNMKQKSKGTSKPKEDITKYITNKIKTINDVPNTCDSYKNPVLKDSSNINTNATKTNKPRTAVVVKNKVVQIVPKRVSTPVFTGSGKTVNTGNRPDESLSVKETVRNIWTNKKIPTGEHVRKVDPSLKKPINSKEMGAFKEPVREVVSNPKKHKADANDIQSPPAKQKKIEDFFNATSILKDLYGDEYNLTKSNDSTKLVAVNVKVDGMVDCPVCSRKFCYEKINTHLDECLSKDIIGKLSKDGMEGPQESPPTAHSDSNKQKEITPAFIPKSALPPTPESKQINTDKPERNTPKKNNAIPPPITAFTAIPAFKPIPPLPECSNDGVIDLTNYNFDTNKTNVLKGRRKSESQHTSEIVNIDTVTKLVKEIDEAVKANTASNSKRRNTHSFIETNRGDYLPSEKVTNQFEDKAGPSTDEVFGKICPCCGKEFGTMLEVHLDECLMFFENNDTIPDDASTCSTNKTIVIDDEDDIFDESKQFNATGTKTPCPCCMKMVEQDDMNSHLDLCLQS